MDIKLEKHTIKQVELPGLFTDEKDFLWLVYREPGGYVQVDLSTGLSKRTGSLSRLAPFTGTITITNTYA